MAAPPRQAIVLTAGLGTRLRPLTNVRAKPAIPVGGEPLIRRIIRYLARHGVDDVVLNLHHLPETVTRVVGDGADLSVRVRYSWEQPVVLGSAGGPRHALPLIDAETFFVVNGDTLTDTRLDSIAAAHHASGALATLALVPNVEPDRYGGVLVDRSGAVTGFVSRGTAAERSYHFVGVQIVSADVFRPLVDGVPVNSIGNVYDRLIASRPGSVRAFVHDANFWDVGTVADYLRTCEAFADKGSSGAGTVVDPTATVSASVLWDDVTVGPGCVVERCIVTDRVRLPPHSRVAGVVVVAERNGTISKHPLGERA